MSKIKSFTKGATSSGMMTWYAAVLDCGHMHYSEGWKPFPSTVTVGNDVPCERCQTNADAAKRLQELDLTGVAYFRYCTRFGGRYLAYRRDKTSPTGVLNFDAFPATPEIDAIIDARRICALSPTEGRT